MIGPAGLPQSLLVWQDAAERALRDQVHPPSSSGLPLYRMMQYQLGWVASDGVDEPSPPFRFHGSLCLEAAATAVSLSQARLDAGPAAAAAELMYQAVAVHEDLQVAEPHMEGRAAVWWVWGPAQAINVGDGLHALARLALFRLLDRGLSADRTLAAVATMDAGALRYFEGQYMELTFQERIDVTEQQYLKMATAKRGSLMGLAVALGAHAAGAPDATVETFRAFGERLGVATQIAEDTQLLWSAQKGREGAGRVLNKSKLYPVVHALERATLSQKRELGGIYFKRVMEPEDLDAVRHVLDEVGAREHSAKRAAAGAADALQLLEQAGLSADALDRWKAVADALVGTNSWRR